MRDINYYDDKIYNRILSRVAFSVKQIRNKFPDRHKGMHPGLDVIAIKGAINDLRLQKRLAERLGIEEAICEGYKLA